MRGVLTVIDILPRTSKNIVGLNITPRTITCSWISHTPDDQTPYELKAYKHMLIEVHPKTSSCRLNQKQDALPQSR